MSARASVMVVSGACAIALALLLPFLELGLRPSPLALLVLIAPWLALAASVVSARPLLSHGLFPATFLVAGLHLPELFGTRAYADVGGALSLFAVLAAFGVYLGAARRPPSSPPRPAAAAKGLASPEVRGARIALAFTLAALVVPPIALWIPLLNHSVSPASLALAALMSATWALALTVHVDRLGLVEGPLEPHVEPSRVASLRLRLQRGRRQTKLGVTVGFLMGLAWLAWYLLRGLS